MSAPPVRAADDPVAEEVLAEVAALMTIPMTAMYPSLVLRIVTSVRVGPFSNAASKRLVFTLITNCSARLCNLLNSASKRFSLITS